MDPARWARLDQLFAAAEALPAAEREALIESSFAADPDSELRRDLEGLLAVLSSGATSRVDDAIAGGLSQMAVDEAAPSRLGPYQIGREIGRGGMATVYEAERSDQEFRRTVAVKVLRRGMDTADIVRRLRRERQILANLDHPGIARLLDGGSTADGRPYVVMEHIAGEPIDRYCQTRGLDLPARLELFRRICEAVHFAHRNLVLHRDIKPSNILVTADGQPKLLDFGIAKILQDDDGAGEATVEPTLTGLRLLTPEWASPEQLRGENLSTASDVYSLGLLLYLLVTGERAYRVDAKNYAELERVVCEVEPKSPGRGDDLDVVVLAALRKEPARRYASAEQLGEDVRRFLENLPIGARRDTFSYRASKFVRRHRWAVAGVATVFLTLLVAALVTAQQARVAREQRRIAEDNLARAEQVATFLTDIFEVSDPGEARGRTLTAREVLDQGVRRMRFSLREDPQLRADLLGTMGRVYQKLGLYDDASLLLEEAYRLHRGASGELAGAASQRDLSALALRRGQLELAQRLAREALASERANAAQPLEIARSLKLLADVEAAYDHAGEAEKLYAEAWSLQRQLLAADAEEALQTRNSLGEMYFRQGATDKARAIFEEVLAARRRTLAGDHPQLATTLNNLAATRWASGDMAAAKILMLEVLAIRRKIYGPDHAEVALALNNLANIETLQNDLQSAVLHLEEALAINRQRFREPHPEIASILHNLGALHQKLEDRSRAAQLYREALEMRQRSLGEGHPAVAETLRNLGQLFEKSAPATAEAYYRKALDIDRRVLVATDPRIANSLAGLGRLAMGRAALAEAERLFREEIEIRRQSTAPDWRLPFAQAWLGHVLCAAPERQEQALPLLTEAATRLRESLGEAHPRAVEAAEYVAECRRR